MSSVAVGSLLARSVIERFYDCWSILDYPTIPLRSKRWSLARRLNGCLGMKKRNYTLNDMMRAEQSGANVFGTLQSDNLIKKGPPTPTALRQRAVRLARREIL